VRDVTALGGVVTSLPPTDCLYYVYNVTLIQVEPGRVISHLLIITNIWCRDKTQWIYTSLKYRGTPSVIQRDAQREAKHHNNMIQFNTIFYYLENKVNVLSSLNEEILSKTDVADVHENIVTTDEYSLDLELQMGDLRDFSSAQCPIPPPTDSLIHPLRTVALPKYRASRLLRIRHHLFHLNFTNYPNSSCHTSKAIYSRGKHSRVRMKNLFTKIRTLQATYRDLHIWKSITRRRS
jgi:hypothetical protein